MRKAGLAGLIGVTAALGLMLAAPASADTIKHKGTVAGQPGAVVKFALKKNGGRLQKITNLRFNGVPVTCEDGTGGAITARLPKFHLAGKEKFTRKGPIEGPGISDGVLRAFGKLKSGGRKARGNLRVAFQSSSGSGCGTSSLNWSTKKR